MFILVLLLVLIIVLMWIFKQSGTEKETYDNYKAVYNGNGLYPISTKGCDKANMHDIGYTRRSFRICTGDAHTDEFSDESCPLTDYRNFMIEKGIVPRSIYN